MADKQYDVSEGFQELFKRKQQQRNETKLYYRRLLTNPYRPEGIVIDPMLQRYSAMSQYAAEFHRSTPRNVMTYIGFLFIPIVGLTLLLKYRIHQREELYRSGKVAYADRWFKMLH